MERFRIVGIVAGYVAAITWLYFLWRDGGYLSSPLIPLKLAAVVAGIILLHKGLRAWAIAAWATFVLVPVPFVYLPFLTFNGIQTVGPLIWAYDGWQLALPPELSPIGILFLLSWLSPLVALTAAIVVPAELRESRKAGSAALAQERAMALAETQHSQRVAQIGQWEAAYRDAHNGDDPPAGFVPPLVAPSAPLTEQTNVMAILALSLSFVAGIFGIIFGHIALNQISRTGERGRGLAIAGLAIGYVTVGVVVLYFVLVGALLANGF